MFITPENINTINFEFTDYCNAACPMCARFNESDGKLNTDRVNKNHTTLELLKKRIPEKIIKQLKKVHSVGTYGDPIMNPQVLDIYRWVRELNPTCRLEMHSNGGARNEDFWRECGELGIVVMFGIDGLEDTNHLYRRNVNWDKLMNNVKAFIQGGGEAQWKWLVFRHNEHQIEQARKFALDMGFTEFNWTHTTRFKKSNWVTGELQDLDKWPVDDYFLEKPVNTPDKDKNAGLKPPVYNGDKNQDKKVICQMASNNVYEIYIRATGVVQPCCMLGELDLHEGKRLIDDHKSININYTDLVDILNGEFFKRLDEGINKGTKDRLMNCLHTCGVK
jgi:MoaA/NifB/PqqE/SkfB family radical SAM enzyme